MAPRIVERKGQYFEFPEDTTDDDIITHFGARDAMGNVVNGIANAMMSLRAARYEPPATTLPNIKGSDVVGLGLPGTQHLLEMVQQDNQNAVANQMTMRHQTLQQIEAEKDRAQQIKLADIRFKNEQKLAKLQADYEANRPKVGVAGSSEAGYHVYEHDPRTGSIAHQEIIPPVKKPVTVSASGELVDPETGQAIYTGSRVESMKAADQARERASNASANASSVSAELTKERTKDVRSKTEVMTTATPDGKEYHYNAIRQEDGSYKWDGTPTWWRDQKQATPAKTSTKPPATKQNIKGETFGWNPETQAYDIPIQVGPNKTKRLKWGEF